MNHALEADFRHTRERLGLDCNGVDAAAARTHSKQAGREAAFWGQQICEASGHITHFPVLFREYSAGFCEAGQALASGMCREFLATCLDARTRLDQAILARDSYLIAIAAQSIFNLAADRDGDTMPFFDDTPEVLTVIEAAGTWRKRMNALEASEAAHVAWLASLPSAEELMKHAANAASAEGESVDIEGYTLWCEPNHGGWSLTNAYGIDNCAFLSTERDFQWLLGKVRNGQEIGPIPPYCHDPDDSTTHPDYDAMIACDTAASNIATRLNIADAP